MIPKSTKEQEVKEETTRTPNSAFRIPHSELRIKIMEMVR